MSLLDTIRGAVKIADDVTKSLQATVQFSRRVSTNAYGEAVYVAPVSLRAVVEWKQQMVRTQGGTLVASRVNLTLLNAAEVTAATGGVGITTADKIVLPAGETSPIVSLDGFMDAGTGRPVATQVFFE